MSEPTYDVIVLGGGFAGCALAAILAKQGLDVLVLEAREHPRFAIGESMILETSEVLRALGEIYDVPELAWFSSEAFLPEAGTSHGVKRHFGFMHHDVGQRHDPSRALQAVIPERPHGHELHLYRQDADQRMMLAAIQHGATVRQRAPVEHVATDGDGATVTLRGGERVSADYVVDCSGFGSVLAKQEGLRDQELATHSRALFTHVLGVPDVGTADPGSVPPGLPFQMAEGTLHHLFDGGWLWVIPFDNHRQATNPLCSIGILLDPRVHPAREGVAAEQEVAELLARHPTIAAQLEGMVPVRPWVATQRLQYGSSRVVGDRWCVLGHAAGFVDPLFSKGLYASLAAAGTVADLLITATETKDWSREAFLPLEQQTQAFVAANDQLAATAYASFRHPALWRATSVLWLAGAYTELLKLHDVRVNAAGDRTAYRRGLNELRMVGGGFPAFERLSQQCAALVAAAEVGQEEAVAAQMTALIGAEEWMPNPFRAVLQGATSLPRRKVRVDVVRHGGFLGLGAYRAHFFRTRSAAVVVFEAVRQTLRYAPATLGVGRFRSRLIGRWRAVWTRPR